MANVLALFQKLIHGAANQLSHGQAGLFGGRPERLQLRISQMEVHPMHTPSIHTAGKNTTAIFLLACLLAAPAAAQEVAVPDKPVVATVTSYKIIRFEQEREPDWRFVITFVDSNGKVSRDEHYGPTSIPNPAGGEPLTRPEGADTFLKQMNTTNFSTTSLTKRLLQHLVSHGKIPAATVTGTPETAQ